MKITRFNLNQSHNKISNSKVVAYCDVELSPDFSIYDLQVIDGKNGIFVRTHSKKINDGKYVPLFRLSDVKKQELENAVLKAYLSAIKK